MCIRSLHFTVHPVEVHKQSHQASRRARTLEYCPRTTRVKIFVEIISRMTCNSRNSRKFRPAKFKRYTVVKVAIQPRILDVIVATVDYCSILSWDCVGTAVEITGQIEPKLTQVSGPP